MIERRERGCPFLSGQGDRGESREGDRGVGAVGWLHGADGLVCRTVLLRGGLGWLAVRRGRGWRRGLRVNLVGEESVRLHVSRMVMVVLVVMGVEDGLCGGGGAGGADADTDADSYADRVGERRRGDRRWRSGGRRRGHRDRDARGRSAPGRRLVIQYRHPDQSLGGVGHVRRLQFGGKLPLPLVTTVLEPDLHLGLGQREREGQVEPLAHRQVSRRLELVLEGDQLLVSERRPGPPRLPACPTAAPPGPVLAALVLTLATLRLDAARRGGGGGGLPLLAVGRGHVARRTRVPVSPRARGLLVGHPHLHVLVLLLLVRLLVHFLHPRLGRALLVLLAAPAGELAPRVTI